MFATLIIMHKKQFSYFMVLLLLTTASAHDIKVPRSMDSCTSLEACMAIMDKIVPAESDGSDSGGKVLATKLKRFGDPAKHELLKRAAGDHCGWRNLAGAILIYWGAWEPSDVPELRAALRKDHGGWLARPLGEIGTPEAIQALVEDLPNGSQNQTDGALSRLGVKAIPYLFPLLESDKNAESAAHVISDMGGAALPFATKWAAQAGDRGRPQKVRLAALRGIAAIGDRAESACTGLHGLIADQDPKIRKQAMSTLKAVRDPLVAREVVRSCRPSADPFDAFAFSARNCLSEIAHYGDGARQVGRELLSFLNSENGAERAYVITTLGVISYEGAVPEIVKALDSADWRVVYAATRSLGWLGAKQAIPALEKTASSYWLPEVRTEATRVLAALRSPKGVLDRPLRLGLLEDRAEPFAMGYEVLGKNPLCKSHRWRWNRAEFSTPDARDYSAKEISSSLRTGDGEFVGTDRGEWGGELVWRSSKGEPHSLRKDNVVGIERDGDGVVALFGLNHMGLAYGYALNIDQTLGGKWKLTEVARLPAEADALAAIGPGIFAAWSSGRVVVFSRQGIQGLAACVSP